MQKKKKKNRSPGPSMSSKYAVNNISDACARRVPMYDTLILRTNIEALEDDTLAPLVRSEE